MIRKAFAVALGIAASGLVLAQWGGASEDCAYARDEAESAASELLDQAQALVYCAEAEDFTDDCNIELTNVQNAGYDYESAVSEFQDECQ
jgi:hypothetical protein